MACHIVPLFVVAHIAKPKITQAIPRDPHRHNSAVLPILIDDLSAFLVIAMLH